MEDGYIGFLGWDLVDGNEQHVAVGSTHMDMNGNPCVVLAGAEPFELGSDGYIDPESGYITTDKGKFNPSKLGLHWSSYPYDGWIDENGNPI